MSFGDGGTFSAFCFGLWGWDDDVLEGYELILDGEGFLEVS
jgi:hypothetical protein